METLIWWLADEARRRIVEVAVCPWRIHAWARYTTDGSDAGQTIVVLCVHCGRTPPEAIDGLDLFEVRA